MKKIYLLFLMLVFSCMNIVQAQNYLEEQYDVDVTLNVVYGVNATILPVIAQQSNQALPQPLIMDVYTPDNNEGNRPVMLVFHTGNFLPFPTNNGTGGTIRDSTVVEACTRFAKRGYVACAVDYRLGWNPIDPSQDIRTFFLINAAYRGVQDARTAVRFLRKGAVDGGNPYQIDPDKIGTFGIGTGGYIVAATATLDEYNEILVDKFFINLSGTDVPMVLEPVNGNIYGTSVGIVPPGYPVLPAGDTLCYPNHVNYANGDPISSDISFTVNLGGALGDLSWIDENVKPWVSFHVPDDGAAPYTSGTLTVPGTGNPTDPNDDFQVVDVDGSYNIQQKLNELGLNDIFDNVPSGFPDFNTVANARNDGYEGLFPFPNNINNTNDNAPWDFYSASIPTIPPNPMPNAALARTYWDTIFAYVAPRACLALDLGCNLTSINNIDANEVGFTLAPNPAGEYFRISTDNNNPMLSVELFDVTGKAAQSIVEINNSDYYMDRSHLAPGLYYVKVNFENGSLVQKVVLE